MTAPGARYLLERAWVDGAFRDEVLVEVTGGRFSRVEVGQGSPPDRGSAGFAGLANPTNPAERPLTPPPTPRPGLTIPGLANTHSHAFHRALRGRTQRESGDFWTWRTQMYDVAARLDPDSMFELARATYREMMAGGITTVGEFHYLHHQTDGSPYDDPNAMGVALVEAAREAGLRVTLLDACYLASGIGTPPAGVQVRFSDGNAAQWARRVEKLETTLVSVEHAKVGAAIHSVRAVPADQIPIVVEAARGGPLHVHLSEQRAENQECLTAYGLTPTQLLHEAGALGAATSVVHATHLTSQDIGLLGETGSLVVLCPTTERDLGDGIGPARRLHEAGSPLCVGSDSHAMIDLFEEMRATELDERLATERRGHWSATELLMVGTVNGQTSLGWSDAGAIEVGQRADLVTLDRRSLRTAGTGADEQTVVFAATASDVTHVLVDGREIAVERTEIGHELDEVIGRLLT